MRIAIINGRDMYPPAPDGYEIVKLETDDPTELERLIEEVNEGAFDIVLVWHATRRKPLNIIKQIDKKYLSSVAVCGRFAWEYPEQVPYDALGCTRFIDARFGVWEAVKKQPATRPPVPPHPSLERS